MCPRIPLFVLAISLLGCVTSALAQEPAKPNILWIVSDDLGAELGCYGDPLVKTPNLDKLAAEGLRFERAYSSSPVCSASRSAIITGMYQTSIGAHHHRTMKLEPLPNGVKTVPQLLAEEAGYRTLNIKGMGANGKLDFNFEFDEEQWLPSAEPEALAEEGEPFFAQVNFFEPHRKFVEVEDGVDPNEVELPPYYPDYEIVREDWARYLDSVEVADEKTGALLDFLEKEGLAENTVVFFFGDHGRPHLRGKQWLYEGGIHTPLIVRWPGKIQPGEVRDDLTSLIDVAATTLNIAGVELPEGLEGQPFLGPNLPEPREFVFAARDRCGDAPDRVRAVITKRYKYIRNYIPELPYYNTSRYKSMGYPVLALMKDMAKEGTLTPDQARFFADDRPAEELYDLQADPHEIKNLAANPEYEGVLTQMQGAMDSWVVETGDMGANPEPLELRQAAEASSYKAFTRRGWEPDEWDEKVIEIRKELGIDVSDIHKDSDK